MKQLEQTLPGKPEFLIGPCLKTNRSFSFSQHHEDEYLRNHFFKHNDHCVYNGTYLEIGALDGITFSNTLWFDTFLKWGGFLIEMSPFMAAKLKDNRGNRKRNFIFANAICEESEKSVRFSSYCPTGSAACNQINPNGNTEVPCITLKKMFISREGEFKRIDFLSLDVEGAEMKFLNQFPFREVEVGVWLIETPKEKWREKEIDDLMEKNGLEKYGYVQPYGNIIDSVYYSPEYLKRLQKAFHKQNV